MTTHPRWRSSGATLVVAVIVALVAALLPASPALALPSGSGWSASWSYYHPTAYQYAGTLPGVRLTGYATDSSGVSSTVGTIEDTANDSRCARVLLYANGVGYIADRTTCGNGSYLTYSTVSYQQGLLVIVYRMIQGTSTHDKGFHLYIPPSLSDSQLRTVGTGASWSYYTSTAFQYSITRPGVRLTGYGAHQYTDQRSSLNTVEKTATTLGCASGRVTGGTTTSGSTCANGGSASFTRFDHTNNLEASACYQPTLGTQRCLALNIPEPW
ncbi:hypothetical protein ACN26Y_14790 [Micromonospora sp. WMMD558]|uniref:hypothetical protein n=1 Tax=unclassified Micromonospora TaxID=2617518 RepID=UPI0012B44476|nr:hypothetical protein [Micromonospora sp. WMMC415]QGN47426.1 hypothetical protein GKC29_11615 [Micromonospora sp. WMMC415]